MSHRAKGTGNALSPTFKGKEAPKIHKCSWSKGMSKVRGFTNNQKSLGMEIAGYLFMDRFPHPEHFSFSLQISYHAQSVLSSLPGNGSGSRVVLIPPYSPCPLPATHSCPYAVLSCAYQQELQQGCFFSSALSHLAPLLQPHLALSHGVLISTVLVYYQQSLLYSTAIQLSMFDNV